MILNRVNEKAFFHWYIISNFFYCKEYFCHLSLNLQNLFWEITYLKSNIHKYFYNSLYDFIRIVLGVNSKSFLKGPQLRPDEACDFYGVDQGVYMYYIWKKKIDCLQYIFWSFSAIHMDDLPVFLHNQISKTGAKKNLILWYDYLNPTHSNVHRLVHTTKHPSILNLLILSKAVLGTIHFKTSANLCDFDSKGPPNRLVVSNRRHSSKMLPPPPIIYRNYLNIWN